MSATATAHQYADASGLDPRRWKALAVAQFMVVIDASIVNVALPSIQTDLGFSESGLQWVVNACTKASNWLCMGAESGERMAPATSPALHR